MNTTMKLKLTLLAALLLLAANCLAQTLTLTHQGFVCPAGEHPWIYGDVTNSAHKVRSFLYKYTDGVGITLEATNQVTATNWTSAVQVLSFSSGVLPTDRHYFQIYSQYEDECFAHLDNWLVDKMTYTGTLSNSTPFNQSNFMVMPGRSYQPFGNTNFGSVYLDGSFEAHSSFLFGDDPWEVGFSANPATYDMPVHPPSVPLEWDRWPMPAVQPGPPSVQSIQMNAHHDQVFALYTSTNLTNWVYVSDVVADEWGWVDHDVSTNLLSIEQQFWQLVYTNSP